MHSITLYHTEWCPECALVRSRLDELEIEYKSVIVPTVRPLRKQVLEVSGQYGACPGSDPGCPSWSMETPS